MVQWFSGFQECSSAVRGLRSIFQNSLGLIKKKTGGINRDEEGRSGKVGFGNRTTRRDGVTRLIKLFYHSKLQNLQVQNFIFNKMF